MARPTLSAQPLAGNCAVDRRMAQHAGRTLLTSRNHTLLRLQNMPKSLAMIMNQLLVPHLSRKRDCINSLVRKKILVTQKVPIYLALKCLRPSKKPLSLPDRIATPFGPMSLLRK
jgi:hypothetical protein